MISENEVMMDDGENKKNRVTDDKKIMEGQTKKQRRKQKKEKEIIIIRPPRIRQQLESDGNQNNALVNGNFAAAEHLVRRGASLTLEVALCLGWWDEVDRFLPATSDKEKQFALVLSALHGKSAAVRRMIDAGADLNAPSAGLYSHGTPLHHAVSSGSLDAVKVLVESGANPNVKDSAWGGTPLGWAHHYLNEGQAAQRGKEYAEIATFLDSR
jgi:peptide-methionine (S)-S-oxide reductase